jgi:hypothetical protein
MNGIIDSNQKIVTNGLILNLDAAQRRSYPGTGTTWTDLSGTSNNGTLVNSPSFNSANGGSIVFNGSNNYTTLPANFFNQNSASPFSISFWFKTSTSGIILGQQNTNNLATATGYVPAIYIDSLGKVRTSTFWGNSISNQSVSSLTVSDNVWHNVVVTFASSSQVSYIDNTQFATLSKTQTTYNSIYYYFIGSGTWSSWINVGSNPYFNGSIANMYFYNRALSATEVAQNYNAIKSRFGL